MGEHYGILGRNPHKRSPDPPGPRGTRTNLLGSTPSPTGHRDLAAAQAFGGRELSIHLPGFGPRRDANSPLLVPPESVGDLVTVKAMNIPIGGVWGDVAAGSNWHVADGPRFVILPTSYDVLYYQNGHFFIQSKEGFVGEVNNWYSDVARHCGPVQRVFLTELKLLLGIIAGASGVGFAVVIGSEAFAFVVEHRDDFAVWRKSWATFLEVRATLQTCAPDLYENLVNGVLKSYGKEWYSQLQKAAETPETISFFIGVVVGHIAERVVTFGPLTPIFVIWTLLKAVVFRFIMDIAPDAAKFAAHQFEVAAKELIERARRDGVTLTPQKADKIIHEINENRACIVPALKKLTAAMEPLEKTLSKH